RQTARSGPPPAVSVAVGVRAGRGHPDANGVCKNRRACADQRGKRSVAIFAARLAGYAHRG
ncbi:MAG: hypothetical protein WBB04_05475, partial [Candidatus Macondimonas sp.]